MPAVGRRRDRRRLEDVLDRLPAAAERALRDRLLMLLLCGMGRLLCLLLLLLLLSLLLLLLLLLLLEELLLLGDEMVLLSLLHSLSLRLRLADLGRLSRLLLGHLLLKTRLEGAAREVAREPLRRRHPAR